MARFTTRELTALAEYAHDLGYSDYYATPKAEKPDATGATLERLALDTLAATALFAAHADDETARKVWSVNFERGWQYADSRARKYYEATIEIEGVEASDAQDEHEEDEDALTEAEMEHLCLMMHGLGDDTAYEDGSLNQHEAEIYAEQLMRDSKLLAPFVAVPYVRNHLVLNFVRGYDFQRTQNPAYEKALVDGREIF